MIKEYCDICGKKSENHEVRTTFSVQRKSE